MFSQFNKDTNMPVDDQIKEKLYSAVVAGDLEAVRRLISTLPLNFRKSWSQRSELISKALMMKKLDIAKLLIGLGSLTDGYDAIIPLAITEGDLETVKMLQEINTTSSSSVFVNNMPPLFSTARRFLVDEECTKIFDHFLSEGNDINCQLRSDGYTILHMAIDCGNENIIPLIIDRNCNINITTIKGLTALHLATIKRYPKIVSLLLEHGAQYDVKDMNGWTPLHYAAEKGFFEIIEILIDFATRTLTSNWINEFDNLIFYCSAATGKKEIVEMFLKRDIDIDKYLESGKTSFFIAAENGHTDIVKLMLEKFSTSNISPVVTQYGNIRSEDSALHIAAEKGHEEIVKLLLQNGANPLLLNKNGQNPLHLSAKAGSCYIITELLNSCSISSIFIAGDNRGYTPLHIAIENSQEEAVKVFIEKGFSSDSSTKYGITSLHIAAQAGHNGIVLLLFKYGTQIDFVARVPVEIHLNYIVNIINSDVFHIELHPSGIPSSVKLGVNMFSNAESSYRPTSREKTYMNKDFGETIVRYEENFTPLYVAAYYGHNEVVRTLLERGADPNVCFKNFLTPLLAAAQEGHQEIVELLLRRGAKVNLDMCAKSFSTPLVAAAKGGHQGIVELLLQFGADANARLYSLHEISKGIELVFQSSVFNNHDPRFLFKKSHLGYTSLHFAVEAGNMEMVEMLLKCGANVNAKSEDRITPLHLAASNDSINIIQKLIDCGARFDSLCAESLTPFFHAVKYSKVESLKTLLIKGAAFETHTVRGEVPLLHFALNEKCSERMIRYLLRCGAVVNAKNFDGLTVLHRFIDKTHFHFHDQSKERELGFELFKLCVENCPDVNILSDCNMQETVLHIASKNGRDREVDLLLDYDADINQVDRNGKTPLQYLRSFFTLFVTHSGILNPRQDYEFPLANFESIRQYNLMEGIYPSHETFQNYHRNRRTTSYRDNNMDNLVYKSILCSITRTIATLEASKKHIHSENQKNTHFLKPYYNICKREIEKMRKTKILNRVTLFDILVAGEDKLAYFAGNKTILETVENENLAKSFPIYARFLNARIKRGLKRIILIEKSLGALKTALDFELPIIVAYEVLDYLSLIELANLCKACLPLNCETFSL